MKTAQFLNVPRTALLTLAIGLLASAANAQPTPSMPADMKNPMPMMGQGMNRGMGKGMDMKPMMTDMQDKMMAMKSSGNVDVDFAMMMRVHHQAAITMAEAELQNGKDPQMRVMAKDIIYAQKKEIVAFDRFLAKRVDPGMKTPK
jgi:uncharacterized protein (DUF305 family)